jgi:hypothetical protein
MDWARITFGVSNHTLQLDETCGGNKWVALAMDPQIHVEKMFDSMAFGDRITFIFQRLCS